MDARIAVGLWLVLAATVPAPASADGAPPVDVGVTLQAPPEAATVGAELGYTLDVRNLGDRRAKDVRLDVRFDGSAVLVVGVPPGCEARAADVRCAWKRLGGGEQAQVQVHVRPAAEGDLTATAEVRSDGPDSDAANDTAFASTEVRAEVPAPAPAPAPAPVPVPVPDPAPAPAPDPGSAPPQEPDIPVLPSPPVDPRTAPPVLSLLLPVPVVRLAGRLTRGGARVTLLTVRTPPDVRITVTCTGRTCPFERLRRTVAPAGRRAVTVRIRGAERAYRAGTRIDVAVQRRGRLGKHTAFEIRRGRFPRREDACIASGTRRPRPCPPG